MAERLLAVLRVLVTRANAIAVFVGMVVLISVAWRINAVAGEIALGLALVVAGTDFRAPKWW